MGSLTSQIAALGAAAKLLSSMDASAAVGINQDPHPLETSTFSVTQRANADLSTLTSTNAPSAMAEKLLQQPEQRSFLPENGTPTVQQLSNAVALGSPSDYSMAVEQLTLAHLNHPEIVRALESRARQNPDDIRVLENIPRIVLEDSRLENVIIAAIDSNPKELPSINDYSSKLSPHCEERWVKKAAVLLEVAAKENNKEARGAILASLTESMVSKKEIAPYLEEAIRENPFSIVISSKEFWSEARQPLLLSIVQKLSAPNNQSQDIYVLQNAFGRGVLDRPEIQSLFVSRLSTNFTYASLITAETAKDPHVNDLLIQGIRTSNDAWNSLAEGLRTHPQYNIELLRRLQRPSGPEMVEKNFMRFGDEYLDQRMRQVPTIYSALLHLHDRGDVLPNLDALPALIETNPRVFSQAIAVENVGDTNVYAAYNRMVRAYDVLGIDTFNHCDNAREIIRQRYATSTSDQQSQLKSILGDNYFDGVELDKRPIANVFVSKADHNGAIEGDSIRRNANELCCGYRVRLFQVNNREELTTAIWASSKGGTEKASVNFISGHGSPQEVALGRYAQSRLLTIQDKETLDAFKLVAAEGSILISRACNTGAPVGRGVATNGVSVTNTNTINMAEAWHSRLPGVRVFAPRDITTDAILRFNGEGKLTGCYFESNGREIQSAKFDGEQ